MTDETMTEQPEVIDAPKPRGRPRRMPPRRAPTRSAADAARVGVAAAPLPSGEATRATRETPPEGLSRRSRRDGTYSDFDIPAHRKRPGWDYEWKTTTVVNQPVDPSAMARVYEGGWRPAESKDFPELCPPGWDKPTVERLGQMLFTRPMHLTQEAKAEDADIANEQKFSKMKAIFGGSGFSDTMGDQKLVRPTVTDFTIEGEVGR